MTLLTISSKHSLVFFPFSFAFAFSWKIELIPGHWDFGDISTRCVEFFCIHILFFPLFCMCGGGFQFSFTRYTVFTTWVVRERRSGWAAFSFHIRLGCISSSPVIPFCCHIDLHKAKDTKIYAFLSIRLAFSFC